MISWCLMESIDGGYNYFAAFEGPYFDQVTRRSSIDGMCTTLLLELFVGTLIILYNYGLVHVQSLRYTFCPLKACVIPPKTEGNYCIPAMLLRSGLSAHALISTLGPFVNLRFVHYATTSTLIAETVVS